MVIIATAVVATMAIGVVAQVAFVVAAFVGTVNALQGRKGG